MRHQGRRGSGKARGTVKELRTYDTVMKRHLCARRPSSEMAGGKCPSNPHPLLHPCTLLKQK